MSDSNSSGNNGSSDPSHLIVVSNRLPVTLAQKGSEWSFQLSSGGLVSALSGLKREMSFTWVGWPGKDFGQEDRTKINGLLKENSCSAVYLDDETAELYYNGFANSILWPLFHYHPGEMVFEEAAWDAYQRANKAFADSIVDIVRDGDLVWIHDYHLMLMPLMLRKLLDERGLKNVKIGWFLHTPFPSSELYRILPVRKEILEGVLAADLLGFHTYDYARHFLSSCARILGLQTTPDVVETDSRMVHVGTFPIGIDPTKFAEALETVDVKKRLGEFEEKFKGSKVIVGVDRLDYIKGVPQKLLAFEQFLSEFPEFVGKVVLVQVAVPSRGDVEEYRLLISNVNELVGRINGRFGTVEYTPIHFLHKSVTFTELVSLYAVSDVCLITSTRDGMNLVSYEYVASQRNHHGVLVLSEFAGAAQSLNGSIIINSWNIGEVSDAIYQALSMSPEQREANFKTLSKYVSKYTAAYWGVSFISELKRVSHAADELAQLPKLTSSIVSTKFCATSKQRLILLDYDGTLSATKTIPEFARPSPLALNTLRKLAEQPNTLVYVFSGRIRAHMDRWFRGIDIGLVAEHGLFYKHPQAALEQMMSSPIVTPTGDASDAAESSDREHEPLLHAMNKLDNGWYSLVQHKDPQWREAVLPLFQHYTERTPGSFIEEKEIDITWHYRNTDPEFGQWQANELKVNLERVLAHLPLTIVNGNKTVEVRPSRIDKAYALRSIMKNLSDIELGFIMAVGDGRYDEHLFAYLASEFSSLPLITSTVGRKCTEAKYYIPNVDSVLTILSKLAVEPADQQA
ncbi:Trehalose-6-P synthase/phosphatase complex synthase subunit [Coemansia sp. RSA 1813]|nr:Trehalose-6-P synthase/phosphatase complex synthase subunit [Coemansia sp. RSA 1646]KAJ2090042.1 Trehalose-6-P synthase/phosphatase complex synthase subunit [Coemansia sp. RSA 986]KAJ2216998.1 Trehalose-6-P synthase/phosphatase complex synthase subunit [Coemansia sp. RSA 487]KAJ2568085.1 Trehalose-6-P synthase/phosphatase complex synthase subunit [Coemansia sp. RSA 1813]